jgi:GNAT superfamily N-acetyltransferase
MVIPAPSTTLFMIDSLRAYELWAGDIPALQRFFDQNPEYFLTVNGQPPCPDEAQKEFDDIPPLGMPFNRKWLLGFATEKNQLIGMASVWSDFLVERVWHVGFYVVATSLHGTGTAQALYRQLETWMLGNGAQWIRLGAVQGYAKPEGFWRKTGFTEMRKRSGIEMGKRTNTLRVMVKPLAEASLSEYLALVARDRPTTP